MAQVNMEAMEYRKLVKDAEEGMFLQAALNKAYTVKWDGDSKWSPLKVTFEPQWSKAMQKALVGHIIHQVTDNEDIMDYLVAEDKYIWDMERMSFETMDWHERLYQGQYDLREDGYFKGAWEAAKERKARRDEEANTPVVMDEKEDE